MIVDIKKYVEQEDFQEVEVEDLKYLWHRETQYGFLTSSKTQSPPPQNFSIKI